jgi:DNA-binding transcriptional LysR family regulator
MWQLAAFTQGAPSGRLVEGCFVTLPALSRNIRAVQEELEQPRLDRVPNRAELATFGSEVLTRPRDILFYADYVRVSRPESHAATLGHL